MAEKCQRPLRPLCHITFTYNTHFLKTLSKCFLGGSEQLVDYGEVLRDRYTNWMQKMESPCS